VLRASRGQVAAEFALVIAFVIAVGVMGVQFLGLALTTVKVDHAAQEAAYVAGSSLEAADSRTPCWAVTGGLAHPQGYADAAICQTVLENLGNVNPHRVSVSVAPALIERTKNSAIHVTITYRQPIDSPLLRLFMGDTFTTTSTASSWNQ
jgi:hypothetical protein